MLKSDRDNDQTIDRNEAKTLALRIKISLQEYGVTFDSEKFLKVIGGDTTVSEVIGIVRKLLPCEKNDDDESDSDDSDDDDDDDDYDLFYMSEDAGNNSSTNLMGSPGKGEGPVSLLKCDKGKKGKRSRLLLKGDSHRRQKQKASAVSDDEESSADSDGEEDY